MNCIDKEVAEKLSKEVSSYIIEQVKHNMDKSIEERALVLYPKRNPNSYLEDTNSILRIAYIRGAEEQKSIDEKKMIKLKSSWENEAQITHNDEDNYKQGYHDAIARACEWLKARNVLTDASLEGFRKAMEE